MSKISFVMPTHNNFAWIGEAMQSLLTQTEKDIEIIIVNDASTDGTTEWLKEYEENELAPLFPYDNRVKIIHNEKNIGAGLSRNLGTEAASSPIIGICDSDDWSIQERAELILKHFKEHPESELVTFPYVNVGYYNETLEKFDGEEFNYDIFKEKGGINYYSNPSSAVKREALLAVGGFGREAVDEDLEDSKRKTDDRIFLENWVKSGRKVDFSPGFYVCGHRCLPNSMMSKLRGWRPEWAAKQ